VLFDVMILWFLADLWHTGSGYCPLSNVFLSSCVSGGRTVVGARERERERERGRERGNKRKGV